MKLNLDLYLSAETLGTASQDSPKIVTIKSIVIKDAKDLPFESKTDKYQVVVEIGNTEYQWLANKSSLRAIAAKYGTDSDEWVGKQIKLWSMDQNVQGKMRKVVYAEAA